jgi:hypothetical protein
LKRVPENLRVDVDWVLSTGLGLKPKSFCGLKMRAGFKWKKVWPFLLDSDPESLVSEVLKLGSVAGLRDASTKIAATAEEGVAEVMELPISGVFDGISDVLGEGFALAMVCSASPQSVVCTNPG